MSFITMIRNAVFGFLLATFSQTVAANGWEHTAIPAETLIKALNHIDAQIRRQAAHSLGHHHSNVVAEALVEALKAGETDPLVRQAIFGSLGKIGSPLALDVIDDCLRHDPEVATRTLCAAAVGNIVDEQSLLLAHFATNDPQNPVKLAAMTSLGYIGGSPAVEILSPFVSQPAPFRLAAIRALGYTSHPSALPVIANFISTASDPKLLVESLKAATLLNSKAVLGKIETVFSESQDPRVRRFALIALHNGSEKGRSHGLIASIRDQDPLMRIQALKLIRELADDTLIAAVIDAGTEFANNFYNQLTDSIRNTPQQTLIDLAVINEFLRTVIAIDPHHGHSLFTLAGKPIEFTPSTPIELNVAQGLYKARWQSIYGAGYTHVGAMDDTIAAGFSDADARLRSVAVRSMGVNNPERFLDETLLSLNDRSAEVRRQGAMVLGRGGKSNTGGQRRLTALLKTTFDTHSLVRLQAISSLGYLGNPLAKERLLKLSIDDTDPRIRASASYALQLLDSS